jgi:hypothetical protein
MLENAMVVLSGLSCIEKTVFQCISTYKYLVKWTNTHGDTSTPSSWYIQQKPENARERNGHSQRSFAH